MAHFGALDASAVSPGKKSSHFESPMKKSIQLDAPEKKSPQCSAKMNRRKTISNLALNAAIPGAATGSPGAKLTDDQLRLQKRLKQSYSWALDEAEAWSRIEAEADDHEIHMDVRHGNARVDRYTSTLTANFSNWLAFVTHC